MSMINEPEPRTEPPEDKIAAICHVCGGEIYEGAPRDCIETQCCADCMTDMVNDIMSCAEITRDYSEVRRMLAL